MNLSDCKEAVASDFSSSRLAARSGLSDEEWRKAIRFDGTDWGWVIMSIGMAIGAGIVFLPVQVGLWGYGSFYFQQSLGIRPCICSKDFSLIPWPLRRNARTIPV